MIWQIKQQDDMIMKLLGFLEQIRAETLSYDYYLFQFGALING